MRDSNYPAGASHDPRAPYNEVEYPEQDFEVDFCITLSATATITTSEWEWDSSLDKPLYGGNFFNDFEERYKGIKHYIGELLQRKEDELRQLEEQARVHKTRTLRMDVLTLKEEIAELKMYANAEIEMEDL